MTVFGPYQTGPTHDEMVRFAADELLSELRDDERRGPAAKWRKLSML